MIVDRREMRDTIACRKYMHLPSLEQEHRIA